MRHFYSLNEFSREQIDEFLASAERHKEDRHLPVLDDLQLALLFLDPSLRTRCSFEVAIRQLGAGVTNLEGQTLWKLETELGKKMDGDCTEHVREAMGVLSRYFDGLGIRSFARGESRGQDLLDRTFLAFMENAKIPVVNMESAMYHPCQALADLFTIKELMDGFQNRKISIVWATHPKALPMAVVNSALLAAAQMGMDVTLAHPEGFELYDGIMNLARDLSAKSDGSIAVTNDRDEGVRGAEVIYAKAWGGLGRYEDPKAEAALRAKNSHWMVDKELMDLTRRAHFMHCLPVRRNVVVTDGVLESQQSVVLRQAENRLHVQKAILEWQYS